MSHFKGPNITKELPEFQPNTSVLELLAKSLKDNGDALALVEGQTGKTATFSDLLQQGMSIAAALRDLKVSEGDYVIICCQKSVISFSALLGVIWTGATAVLYPVPHIDIVPKLTMGHSIKAVICDPEYADTLKASMKPLQPQPVLFATTDPQDKVLASLLKPNGNVEVYKVKNVQKHTPMVFYSSGTTGDPKGIMLTDVGVQLCGKYFKATVNAFLISSPLFWLSALVLFTSSIFKKFTVYSSNSNEPTDNLELIQKYKVDCWFAGTGSLTKYINEPKINNYDISSLDGVVVGGEVTLSSVAEDFKNKVVKGKTKLISGYGSTEGGLICNLEVKPEAGRFEYGLCGKLNAGAEIKIVGEHGEKVPVGVLGEVLVKSPGLFSGYWGRPELNEEVFDKDGFFRSGDVGFFNKKAQLYIRGRVGDVINFRGAKLPPVEVEDILMSHKGILDAAVVGKPHPVDIQHMTAYVVLNPGFHISEVEIQNYVDSKVEDIMKLRGGVHFLDILPRTIIGKVKRKVLRDM